MIESTWLNEPVTDVEGRGAGQPRVRGLSCRLQELCDIMTAADRPERPVRTLRVGPGKTLFRDGDPCLAIYVVTSGAIKSSAAQDHADEQIVDFHFPGEAVGLEAIERGIHSYTARALGETWVCRIDLGGDADLSARERRTLDQALLRAMARQLRHEQQLFVLLRRQTADQRIATFLLSLVETPFSSSSAGIELNLPMSRKDIANYLGVAVETLCRLLKRMQADGLIHSNGRHLILLDVPAMTARTRYQALEPRVL